MRFYFGFSKKIPFKWILFAIGVLLAFLGIHKIAYAMEVTDLNSNGAHNIGSTYSFTLDEANNSSNYMFNFPANFHDTTTDYIVFVYSDSIVNEQEIVYYTSPSTGSYNFNLYLTAIRFSAELFFTDGGSVLCDIKPGYIICQRPTNRIADQIRFNFNGDLINSANGLISGVQNSHYTFYLSNWILLYKLRDNGTQAIIDNNNQNTQAIINGQNNINSSINNSQVDSSSTSGGGFFDNFSVDDSRGFSSIITAPLQFLRDLLTSNSSCSPLSFNIEMKDDNITVSNTGLSLPCGEVLWNRVPQAIELIWVTLVWGLVGYRLLLDMVKFINNSLNPEYSKEYFLDL